MALEKFTYTDGAQSGTWRPGMLTKSHADQRRYMRWTDQHGRPWGGEVEIRSMEPTGAPPAPVSIEKDGQSLVWSPPFPEWLNGSFPVWRCWTNPERFGQCFIDYDVWFRMAVDWEATWMERFLQCGAQLSGDAFNPAKPTVAVQRWAGNRPLRKEAIVAMAQGNRYALGWDMATQTPYTGPEDPRVLEFKPPRRALGIEDAITDMDFRDASEVLPRKLARKEA